MVPEPAATPATGKIRVAVDFAGGLPSAVVLGARRRDNGGWFWNPNGPSSYHPCEKWTRQSARLKLKSAQSGDAFSLRHAKSSVLTGLVVKPFTRRPPPSGRTGRDSVLTVVGR
jgi:hypothetical protein